MACAHEVATREESSRVVGGRLPVRLTPTRALAPATQTTSPVSRASFVTRRQVPAHMADHPRPACLAERAGPPRGTRRRVYAASRPAAAAAHAPESGLNVARGLPTAWAALVGSDPSPGCGGVCGTSWRLPRPEWHHTDRARRQRRGGGGVAALRRPGRAAGTVSATCASAWGFFGDFNRMLWCE